MRRTPTPISLNAIGVNLLHFTKRNLRKNPLFWRYVLNCRSVLSYPLAKIPLSTESKGVLDNLNRDGIAISSTAALLGQSSLYPELCSAINELEKGQEKEVRLARAHAGDGFTIGRKTFLHFLLGDKPIVDSESVFARFALQDQILGIANAYMRMCSQLRYYNVWHTLANGGPARESQLWHRDRDDYLTCKVFVYHNDVDEGAGPFTYARGTHPKGANHSEPLFTIEGGVKRSNDSQMAKVAPRETWVRATGLRGTIIFADTRGYHKGGEARSSDRIMYTCMFVSPASEVREMMSVPQRVKLPSSRSAALALSRYG